MPNVWLAAPYQVAFRGKLAGLPELQPQLSAHLVIHDTFIRWWLGMVNAPRA